MNTVKENSFTLKCNNCCKESILDYVFEDGAKFIQHSDIHFGFDYVGIKLDCMQFKCEYCGNKLTDGEIAAVNKEEEQ